MDDYVKVATSLPPDGQLVTLVGIALILGLGKGGVPGFATVATSATVLTAPSSVAGGLGYAVALMVPILTMIDIYAAWLHRSALDWPTVWILLPTSFVGMALGQALDGMVSDRGARLLVGTILLGILALRTWKDAARHCCPRWAIRWQISGDSKEHKAHVEGKGSLDDVEAAQLIEDVHRGEGGGEGGGLSSRLDGDGGGGGVEPSLPAKTTPGTARKLAWAVTVGLIGGTATMLTNSMGPLLNVYLLSVAKLSPQSYIGTRAMFFCFLNVGKLPLRVYGGTLGLPMLPLAAGLGAVAVLGVFLAKPIMLGMNEKTFVKLELGVVAFAGLRLCYMSLRQ